MTAIGVAIERKEWTLVSLYLLLGVSAAATALPPQSLDALLDILSEGRKGRSRGRG